LLFETHALCKYYRPGSSAEVRALDDVSLTIAPGGFIVLAGPSGSGKTTLLALLGALERPTRGTVLFQGKNLTDCSDVELARTRRRMGFVFQDFSLIPSLSALENITYPLIPRGLSRPERTQRANALLARLGLAEKALVRAGALSGGEQQRVAIARALAGDPEVVLADEPTSNLDQESAKTLLGAFQELHEQGRTVILASHDPAVISLATRVLTLSEGKLRTDHSTEAPVTEASPTAIRRLPSSQFPPE
jgi:putative ABC transport system ATP-binding protein